MLKHLKARENWSEKTLRAKGFTLIELLVVIIILGILAAVVIFAVSSIRKRAQVNTCKTDAKTIKTAAIAWNADYLSGNTNYTTPWPASISDLTTNTDKLLQDDAQLHTLNGTGAAAPTVIAGSKCTDAGAPTSYSIS